MQQTPSPWLLPTSNHTKARNWCHHHDHMYNYNTKGTFLLLANIATTIVKIMFLLFLIFAGEVCIAEGLTDPYKFTLETVCKL